MPLKILHTSDLHIGKKLYDQELIQDHELFFQWLLELIDAEKIDGLLISGDIFDQANPSQDSLKLYYKFLAQLSATGCKTFITAGNHDAPSLIDAPEAILQSLNVEVIGNVPENISELVFTLSDKSGNESVLIAAVPFLRDRDIRKAGEGESYDSRVNAVREGIIHFYNAVSEKMREQNNLVPHIALGHLYAQGAELSDSERDIQIGNQAGIPATAFAERFDYVALGHIHRAQYVGEGQRIRYSGSPLPLSFSEKDYKHKVILLEVENGKIQQRDLEIPRKKKLEVITGSLDECEQKLAALKNEFELAMLVDLYVLEDNYDPILIRKKAELTEKYNSDAQIRIIQSRIRFRNNSSTTINVENFEQELEEITPVKIFSDLIKGYSEEEKKVLTEIFSEIKQEAEEGRGE